MLRFERKSICSVLHTWYWPIETQRNLIVSIGRANAFLAALVRTSLKSSGDERAGKPLDLAAGAGAQQVAPLERKGARLGRRAASTASRARTDWLCAGGVGLV